MAPPKKPSPELEALTARFSELGLNPSKALEVARNNATASSLSSLMDEQNLGGTREGDADKNTPLLLVTVAEKGKELDVEKRGKLVKDVQDKKLQSADQVSEACKFLKSNPEYAQADYEKASGIGMAVPYEDVLKSAQDYVSTNLEALSSTAWSGIGKSMGALKQNPALRWAPVQDIKGAIEQVYTEYFGTREQSLAQRNQQAAKDKEGAKAAVAAKEKTKEAAAPSASTSADLSQTRMFEEGWLAKLHKPGGNPQIKPELIQQHLDFTQGKVFTRFPPEPNGYMHIGHLKALVINFGFAAFHGGNCYLRYDDTNPEAEKQIYIDAILDMVLWLGFEPFRITYASDQFQKLFDCAVELIKRGKAYVDHSTAEEMKIQRGGEERGPRVPSRWRDRPIDESLAEFQAMQDGKYQPGQAVLRMKQNLEDGNPQMWDLVAYRVLNTPHHRTGTQWRIYPTYDFTHCLNDSFENISHSLCTTEFILSRVSYEWLCDALEVYKPRQSEYGRLNLQGTVTSKRKIRTLVDGKYVSDWDDPRMYTLIALKRRGIPPGSLRTFISQLGVTTTNTTLPLAKLEQTIRQYLEATTPRLMVVLKPLKVTITNLPDEYVQWVERPCHPKVPAMGSTRVPFTKTVYIEADDFRSEDSPTYFRMAPGKRVGLLYVDRPVICTSFRKNESGNVVEVFAEYENSEKVIKPKAYIQWVGEHAESKSPVIVDEARLFRPLFSTDDPGNSSDFLSELNPKSLEVVPNAMVEIGFWDIARDSLRKHKQEAARRLEAAQSRPEPDAPTVEALKAQQQEPGFEEVRFQGLRTAYFCIDNKDTKLAEVESSEIEKLSQKGPNDKIVLNTIVSLKEDKEKS